MSTAVVIITAGRNEHLHRTLAGLAQQTRPADEVIIVRMRPDEPAVGHDSLPVRTVDLHSGGSESLPLAAARNIGADASDAEHLVFLDVDCIPAGDLVERYDEVIAGHPGALACGPVRYLREGWDAASAVAPTTDVLARESNDHPARPGVPAGAVVAGGQYELFWSLSFGLHRSTWVGLGGFDEAFNGYGGEDTDFAFRARRAGVPLLWFGGGIAYHQWHRPTRLDPLRTCEIVANAVAFRRRWGSWPMTGWLSELHDLGRVVFDPGADTLEVVSR